MAQLSRDYRQLRRKEIERIAAQAGSALQTASTQGREAQAAMAPMEKALATHGEAVKNAEKKVGLGIMKWAVMKVNGNSWGGVE